ncbi:SOUL family heme-binding protein [Halorhodospira halophila]|uniref:SOUL heme-binding protein n=1 Tax=Halorhodospira halophila (strain DSM 244 / SL1) TaxID=349124 RepID=A1WU35_HALHL|nr:heme-binding protein [Halorhodospira halophila]ABM61197.1 SOUL heme-binding protein [Halorhodospira halophila SL1]MBK1729608.1 heme-binding protein [Halorhodospira halophila]
MKVVYWGLGIAVVLVVGAIVAWWVVVRGVETPDYTVVLQDGDRELRDYPALRVAEVERSGSRGEAVSAGFRPLAGYIFAREREGDSIAMTAPVTQTPEGEGRWLVRFIMPEQYTLEDLPRPTGEEIALRELDAQRMAAIRFSGRASDSTVEEHERGLRAWMAEQGLEAAGEPVYAYYDDPMTPGFLRRNEVLIPVESAPGAEAP